MSVKAITRYCVSLLYLSTAFAQQSEVSKQPPEPITSPIVLPDHRVTFRILAPDAHKVEVSGDFWLKQGRSEAMQKSIEGVWSFTTDPLKPDYYSYFFTVDGVVMPDPANGQMKAGIQQTQSAFFIPSPESPLFARSNETHGQVRSVYYFAGVLGEVRRMQIYLPPGYNDRKGNYPVVYLFHGGGDDETAWTNIGRVNFMLDHLIAQGKAKPMIVVMPSLWALDPPVPKVRNPKNAALFRQTMLNDVVPYVEEHYRVLRGPEHRAVGGLGIGRSFLPNFVWSTMGKFGTVLFVSGGADPEQFAALQKEYAGVLENSKNRKSVKFFMCDGIYDNSFAAAVNTSSALKSLGYSVEFVQSDNTHGWPGFREAFERFSLTAFR